MKKNIPASTRKKTGQGWKKGVRQVHLWLGLTSGLVVLIVSITGCLFVFQKEITEALEARQLFVAVPAGAKPLPLSVLYGKAQQALGTAKPVNTLLTYRAPNRAWEFMAFAQADAKAITFHGSVAYYQSVHLNPYTGEVTGSTNYLTNFFVIVKYLHWSLLLNTPYGQPVVGWSTFVFVVLLLTGLVLWWPKKWNRANRQKSFTIQWKASFKRLNYDLHNVLGFYSLLIALLIALTGMLWALSWFRSAVYAVASGSAAVTEIKQVKSTPGVATGNPLDRAYATALACLPYAKRIDIFPPAAKEGVIGLYGYRDAEWYCNYDELQFDRYSGQLLHRRQWEERNAGERLLDMNYDIHIGAIGGIAGKIIAFLTSLVCASLPVTGFLVWWNKNHRKKKYPVAGPAKPLPLG